MPCPSCGAETTATFCARCGERLDVHPRSLVGFATDAFEAMTNVDGRLLRTLRLLFLAPGALSDDYVRGARVEAMRPLQVFVLANVFYFIFTVSSTFNTPLQFHMGSTNFLHQPIAAEWVQSRIAPALSEDDWNGVVEAWRGRAQPPEDPNARAGYERLREFGRSFNARVDVQSRLLIVLMIPLFAVPLAALNFCRRHYFAEHLVYSTHFVAFMLIAVVLLQWVVLALIGLSGFATLGSEPSLTLIIGMLCFAYCVAASRRFFGYGWTFSIAQGLIQLTILYFALLVYRSLLFFTTWWSL